MGTTSTATAEWFERDGSACERPVYVVSAHVATYSYQDRCHRCGGVGGAEQWRFTGYTCYECGGSGKGKIRSVKVYSAEKLAKLNAAAEKRDKKRQEKLAAERAVAQARLAAWRGEHAEALATMAEQSARSPFLASLIEQAESRPLSDSQVESGIAAAEREKLKAEREQQEWIGTLGARIDVELTVERAIQLSEGGYGARGYYEAARYLVVCRDPAGNAIKYIGSGYFPKREGLQVRVRATVKGHDTYHGAKQTVIERPKIVESA